MITRINYHLRNTAASLRMAADELDKATQVGYENQPGSHLANLTTGRVYGDTSIPGETGDKWQTIMEHLRLGNRIQAIKCMREYVPGMGLKEAKSIIDTLYNNLPPQL